METEAYIKFLFSQYYHSVLKLHTFEYVRFKGQLEIVLKDYPKLTQNINQTSGRWIDTPLFDLTPHLTTLQPQETDLYDILTLLFNKEIAWPWHIFIVQLQGTTLLVFKFNGVIFNEVGLQKFIHALTETPFVPKMKPLCVATNPSISYNIWQAIISPHQIVQYLAKRPSLTPLPSCESRYVFPFWTAKWKLSLVERVCTYFKCTVHDVVLSLLLGSCAKYFARYHLPALREFPVHLHIYVNEQVTDGPQHLLQCNFPYHENIYTRILNIVKYRQEILATGYVPSVLSLFRSTVTTLLPIALSQQLYSSSLSEALLVYSHSEVPRQDIEMWTFLPLLTPTGKSLTCHALSSPEDMQLCFLVNLERWHDPQYLLFNIEEEWTEMTSKFGPTKGAGMTA